MTSRNKDNDDFKDEEKDELYSDADAYTDETGFRISHSIEAARTGVQTCRDLHSTQEVLSSRASSANFYSIPSSHCSR